MEKITRLFAGNSVAVEIFSNSSEPRGIYIRSHNILLRQLFQNIHINILFLIEYLPWSRVSKLASGEDEPAIVTVKMFREFNVQAQVAEITAIKSFYCSVILSLQKRILNYIRGTVSFARMNFF